MAKPKADLKIEIKEVTPLKWPENWRRTLIQDRKGNGAWKKTYRDYRDAVARELQQMGATGVTITRQPQELEEKDPSVAVWFSLQKRDDSSWQTILHIDSPLPTIAEIDRAFRELAAPHHPDKVAQTGGDIKLYYKLDEARKAAKLAVTGADVPLGSCFPYDLFKEPKLNLAAISAGLAHFRGLKRLGMPTILERVMEQTFKASLPARATGSGEEEKDAVA